MSCFRCVAGRDWTQAQTHGDTGDKLNGTKKNKKITGVQFTNNSGGRPCGRQRGNSSGADRADGNGETVLGADLDGDDVQLVAWKVAGDSKVQNVAWVAVWQPQDQVRSTQKQRRLLQAKLKLDQARLKLTQDRDNYNVCASAVCFLLLSE